MGDEDRYTENKSGLFDPARYWDIDVDALLDSVAEEEEWLQNELDRIDEQLRQRDNIHEKIVSELEWNIDRYAERLDRINSKWRGNSEEYEQLKHRLNMLYEELREEYLEHWKDKQQLEDERRQVLRDLDQVQGDYLPL